jgi:hypothetical protein
MWTLVASVLGKEFTTYTWPKLAFLDSHFRSALYPQVGELWLSDGGTLNEQRAGFARVISEGKEIR